eukprot:3244732-Amphidinium_carterae.1
MAPVRKDIPKAQAVFEGSDEALQTGTMREHYFLHNGIGGLHCDLVHCLAGGEGSNAGCQPSTEP